MVIRLQRVDERNDDPDREPDDAAYERYGALRDLLFAETIFG